MWGIFLQHLWIIFRYWGWSHYIQHHLRRSFSKYLIIIIGRCFSNYTHSLQFWLKLISSINSSFMTSFTIKWKYRLLILLIICQSKFTKIECFYLHWVSYQLPCRLYSYYWVICCHIVENRDIVWFFMNICDNIISYLLVIHKLSMKFTLITRYCTIKIHKILCQCSSFIKTSKLDHSTSYYFILLYTKYFLFLQLLNSINNTKSHTDR